MLRCSVARGKNSSSVLPLIVYAPVPGLRITRATAVLRLPVARVARAGGEVDRDRGDRLVVDVVAPRRRASAAASARPPSSSASSGSSPSARCRPRGRRPGSPASRAASRARRRSSSSAAALVGGLGDGLLGGRRQARSAAALGLGGAAPRRLRRLPRRRLLGAAPAASAARRSSAAVLLVGRWGCSSSGVRRLVGHQAVDLHRLRLLRRVRMVRAGVDLELGELLAGEAVAGQHPLDREADDLLGPALEHAPRACATLSPPG